jgi:hypothetical protein
MVVSLSFGPGTWWLTCSNNTESHQFGSQAKLSKHLTPPISPHWLALSFEHRHCVSIHVGWSGWTVISNSDDGYRACPWTVIFNKFTQLVAWEDFINFSQHESFISYKNNLHYFH